MTTFTQFMNSGSHSYTLFQQDSTLVGTRPLGPDSIKGMQRLPSEAIGTFNLTLKNVVIGSRWEIESSGSTLSTGVASSGTILIPISVYATNNDLVVKVRKGSGSPYYQPYETQTTAFVGASSLFINQVSDES